MSARAECVGEPTGQSSAWWPAIVGSGMVLAGWFAPPVCAAGAALLCSVGFLCSRARGAATGAEVAVAAGLTVLFCVKDLLMTGPLGRAAVDLGVASGWTPRQPNLAAAGAATAAIGTCVLIFPLLRGWLTARGHMLAWGRGVSFVSALLAAAVLTAPHATADYGDGFQVGGMASRNAAAGAFALAAMVAAGLVVDAVKARRGREWPLAMLAVTVCVAATVSLGSRGGLVALLVGAVYFMARAGDRRLLRWLLSGGGLVVGVLLLAPGTVARLADLSEEYRLELWTACMRVWSEAPWGGVGGGGFAEAFALFGGMQPVEGARVTHPDSSWVLLLVEWGVVGTAAVVFAGWFLLRVGGAKEHSGMKVAAEAGLVVWVVAAIGDVALHRVALMALGLPLLAIAFPRGAQARMPNRWTRASGVVLAGLLAAVSWWGWRVNVDGAEPAHAGPLDMRVNHARGFDSLNRGDAAGAATYFAAVAVVDPANTEALLLYARGLMALSPESALPFWRRLFVAAGPRASAFLTEELRREAGFPLRYWLEALADRPEAWVVLADRDEAGAQQCYEQWRRTSNDVRGRSPRLAVLGALARWGGTADMMSWLAVASATEISATEGVDGARFLSRCKRGDLAWVWLTHVFPEPPDIAVREPDEGLRARVLASPDDYVAAARLLAQVPTGAERLRLLRRWSERPEAPAWVRIRLAYALRAEGMREEALTTMMAAAEAVGEAKPMQRP